jgi:hypothetical protein
MSAQALRETPKTRAPRGFALLMAALAACGDSEESGPLPPSRPLAEAPVFQTVPAGMAYGRELQVGEVLWEVRDVTHLAGRSGTQVLVQLAWSHQEAGPRRALLLPRLVDSASEGHAPASPVHGPQPTLPVDPLTAPPVEPGEKATLLLRYELPADRRASRLELTGLSPVAGTRELAVGAD